MPNLGSNIIAPINVNAPYPTDLKMVIGSDMPYKTLGSIPYIYSNMVVWDLDKSILYQYKESTGLWNNITFGVRMFGYFNKVLLNPSSKDSTLDAIHQEDVINLEVTTFGEVDYIEWTIEDLDIISERNTKQSISFESVGEKIIKLVVYDVYGNSIEYIYTIYVLQSNEFPITDFIVTPETGFIDEEYQYDFSLTLPSTIKSGNITSIVITELTTSTSSTINLDQDGVSYSNGVLEVSNNSSFVKTFSADALFIAYIDTDDGRSGSAAYIYKVVDPHRISLLTISPNSTSTEPKEYTFTITLDRNYNSSNSDSIEVTLFNKDVWGTQERDITNYLVEGSTTIVYTTTRTITTDANIICYVRDTLSGVTVASEYTGAITGEFEYYEPTIEVTPNMIGADIVNDYVVDITYGKPIEEDTLIGASLTWNDGTTEVTSDIYGDMESLATSISYTLPDLNLSGGNSFVFSITEDPLNYDLKTSIATDKVTIINALDFTIVSITPPRRYLTYKTDSSYTIVLEVERELDEDKIAIRYNINEGNPFWDGTNAANNVDFTIVDGKTTITIDSLPINFPNAIEGDNYLGIQIIEYLTGAPNITGVNSTTIEFLPVLAIDSFSISSVGGNQVYSYSIGFNRSIKVSEITENYISFFNYNNSPITKQILVNNSTSITGQITGVQINSDVEFTAHIKEALGNSNGLTCIAENANTSGVTLSEVNAVVTDKQDSSVVVGATFKLGYFNAVITDDNGEVSINNVPFPFTYSNSYVSKSGYSNYTWSNGNATVDENPENFIIELDKVLSPMRVYYGVLPSTVIKFDDSTPQDPFNPHITFQEFKNGIANETYPYSYQDIVLPEGGGVDDPPKRIQLNFDTEYGGEVGGMWIAISPIYSEYFCFSSFSSPTYNSQNPLSSVANIKSTWVDVDENIFPTTVKFGDESLDTFKMYAWKTGTLISTNKLTLYLQR